MTLRGLAEKLEARASLAPSHPVVAGFDAFVDEILHVVDTRISPEEYRPLASISELGEWVQAAAGRSGLREAVLLESAAGGCAVNLGDGLVAMGFPLSIFAALGNPPDPAFLTLAGRCRRAVPLGLPPGRTDVYEFQDGKLMFCRFSHFSQFTPDFARQALGSGEFRAACEEAAAMVFTSWSVFPRMTSCWRVIQREFLTGLNHQPLIFLDLADPASRSDEDVRAMVEALAGFEVAGPTILSLNGAEAHKLAHALGLRGAVSDAQSAGALAVALRERVGIAAVGIHLPGFATAAEEGGVYTAPGPFCAKPRKSVGAGDRFNAGWLAGRLLGLGGEEALRLGAASSGFFVREARSATLPELVEFLRRWDAGGLDGGLDSGGKALGSAERTR